MEKITPQARAIVAFTLAVSLLVSGLTPVRLSVVEILDVIGFNVGLATSSRSGTIVDALISMAVAAAALAVARQAAAQIKDGWRHLADAAVLLAALAFLVGLLELVAGATLHY